MDEIIQPLENRKLKWSPDILYNFRNLAKARLRDGHHKFKKLHHVLATHKKLPNLLYSLGGCRLEKAVHTYNFLSSPHFLINDTMRKLKEPFMKLPFFRKLFFLIALQYLLHSTMKLFRHYASCFQKRKWMILKAFQQMSHSYFSPCELNLRLWSVTFSSECARLSFILLSSVISHIYSQCFFQLFSRHFPF